MIRKNEAAFKGLLLSHNLPSGKRLHNYGTSPCLMGKSTISMVMFNSYVKLPKGTAHKQYRNVTWSSPMMKTPNDQWEKDHPEEAPMAFEATSDIHRGTASSNRFLPSIIPLWRLNCGGAMASDSSIYGSISSSVWTRNSQFFSCAMIPIVVCDQLLWTHVNIQFNDVEYCRIHVWYMWIKQKRSVYCGISISYIYI